MSTQHDFYRSRAAEALAEANQAKLENVRQRCLRSAEAWGLMAARAERNDRARETTIAAKAAAEAQ